MMSLAALSLIARASESRVMSASIASNRDRFFGEEIKTANSGLPSCVLPYSMTLSRSDSSVHCSIAVLIWVGVATRWPTSKPKKTEGFETFSA